MKISDIRLNISRSGISCCVYGCESRSHKDHDSFHSFPKYKTCKVEITNKNGIVEKVDLRKIWEKNLKCGRKITEFMRVCSKHFEESDFMPRSELCENII